MDTGTLVLLVFLQEVGLPLLTALVTIAVATPICIALAIRLRKPKVSKASAAAFGALCGIIPVLNIAIAIILWRSLPKKEQAAKK